nr:RtcB family protein [Verrucomicrobium spinosum]
MSDTSVISPFHVTGEAEAILPARDSKGKPITVIGTEAIRNSFDATCVAQALNSRSAPGVTDLVLNPDAHAGYGAPVGCVMVSPTHIYPGPVGVDIKCSMSLLQLNIPDDVIADKAVRRALINAIVERTPTGAGRGQRTAKKSRHVNGDLGEKVVTRVPPRKCAKRSGSRRNGRPAAKTARMSVMTETSPRSSSASRRCAVSTATPTSTRRWSSSVPTVEETTSENANAWSLPKDLPRRAVRPRPLV